MNNPETLATLSTQDEDNPKTLATQGTQDEDNPNKNTTQYVVDTIICKQTQIT